MQPLPHHYRVNADAAHAGRIRVDAPGVAAIESAAPPEFGGPGDLWSPETMLAGAVAACFILTFRGVARASSLHWTSIECPTEGLLERKDGSLQFTEFTLRPRITVARGTDRERLLRVIEKAEHGCLVASSLRATMKVHPEIVEADAHWREVSAN